MEIESVVHCKYIWLNTMEKHQALIFVLLLGQICEDNIIAPALFK